jgi:predicted P-loop ATPase
VERLEFDIRSYLGRLTPTKEKGKYICPHCSGHNLSINRKTGAYTCYNGCESQDIREALSPWSEVVGSKDNYKKNEATPKKKPTPKSIRNSMNVAQNNEKAQEIRVPEKVEFARVRIEIPEPTPCSIPSYLRGEIPENVQCKKVVYCYSATQWIERIQWLDPSSSKRRSKAIRPWHKTEDGKQKMGKGDEPWLAYREQESFKSGGLILFVEGEACVDGLNGLGFGATTLQGADWTEETVTDFCARAVESRIEGFLLIPDNDEAGFKKMKLVGQIAASFGIFALEIPPSLILGENPPDKWDIADWIREESKTTMDAGKTRELLEKTLRPYIEKKVREFGEKKQNLERAFNIDLKEDRSTASSTNKQFNNLLRLHYGEKIQINEITDELILEGQSSSFDEILVRCTDDFDLNISIPYFHSAIKTLIKENPKYNPIQEYLKGLPKVESSSLDSELDRIFGVEDLLQRTYLRKFLISAVARAMQPGCQADLCLILYSPERWGKSSFLNDLFTIREDCYFHEQIGRYSGNDARLNWARHWGVELPEIDRFFTKEGAIELKASMSARFDNFSKKFDPKISKFPRRCVFIGTTNRHEFLQEATGSRKFAVVKLPRPIDKTGFDRDKIWAAAYQAWQNGEPWWLTSEEHDAQALQNRDWIEEDPWLYELQPHMEGKESIYSGDLLKMMVEDPSRQTKESKRRIEDCLQQLGWVNKRNKNRRDRWIPSQKVTKPPKCHPVVTDFVTPQSYTGQGFKAKDDKNDIKKLRSIEKDLQSSINPITNVNKGELSKNSVILSSNPPKLCMEGDSAMTRPMTDGDKTKKASSIQSICAAPQVKVDPNPDLQESPLQVGDRVTYQGTHEYFSTIEPRSIVKKVYWDRDCLRRKDCWLAILESPDGTAETPNVPCEYLRKL